MYCQAQVQVQVIIHFMKHTYDVKVEAKIENDCTEECCIRIQLFQYANHNLHLTFNDTDS